MRFPKIPYVAALCGPTISIYFGMLLNKICMAFNHNLMPVLIDNCVDPIGPRHSCMVLATHLKILADWIDMPDSVMSIGDVLIVVGGATLYYGLVCWAVLMIRDYNERSR